MALDADGDLNQILQTFIDIDVASLVTIIQDLRSKSLAWQQALPEIGVPSATEPGIDLASEGMLRV